MARASRRVLSTDPWWVVERERSRGRACLYVMRPYESRDDAQAALDDLLLPYGADHAWRRRLGVEQRPLTRTMAARIAHRRKENET